MDKLVAIGEPVTERDQILQLLGGLGVDYSSMVASLIACEVDIPLHLVHSIVLTHEQRLCFQNSVAEDDVIAADIATSQHRNYNKNGGQSHN